MNDLIRVRQSVTNRSIMQVAADACAAASILFWNWVMWSLIEPQWPATINDIPLSLMSALLSIVLALCWALVLPVLCAAVFPNTAAGMLLQEYQREAWGFMLMAAAAIFLFYQSYFIISIWWTSRTAVAESGLVSIFTIATMIFFVLVPAWTWHQSSPAQWIAEVQQAHAVRKLREAHKAELLMARAAYLRVVAILRRGLDVATIDQRQYAAGVMTALHQAQSTAIGEIAASLQELGAASWVGEDGLGQDYVKKLNQTTDLLFRAQDEPDEFTPEPDHVDSQLQSSQALAAPETAHVDSRPGSSKPAQDQGAQRSTTQRDAASRREAEIVRARVQDGVFTKKEVAKILKVEERTAQESIAQWTAMGLISQVRLGRHSFTE